MTANLIGRTLLGQYRVDAYIASGGMGTVFRVWDHQRNVPLAMKVLHADLAEDPAIFKRFKREARALEKLAHPNIIPFYGLYQTLDFAFLLERYVDGPSLKQILRRKKGEPLPIVEALSYLKAISSALGYAHAHDVVHCDVKPGNVIVDQGGSVFLTDFGVARHAESTTTTLGFAGTAAYMAPEQILGEAVSAATDVYALGVVLYEMLTGRRPFRGDEKATEKVGSTASERVRYAHLHLDPPDPQQFSPDLPDEMKQVILKALTKDPSARWGSVRELFVAACEAGGFNPDAVLDRIQLPSEFLLKPEEEKERFQDSTQRAAAETDSELGGVVERIPKTSPKAMPTRIIMMLGALAITTALVLVLGGPRPPSGGPEQVGIAVSATQENGNFTPIVPIANTRPPTGSPPPAPTRPPRTDTPEIPLVFGFRACLDSCKADGSNAMRSFPEATTKISLLWQYENIPVGAHYVRRWTMDGREWARYECRWPGPRSGIENQVTLTEPDGLHSGTWNLTIEINGQVLLREQIYAEGNWTYWYPAGYFDRCYGKR